MRASTPLFTVLMFLQSVFSYTEELSPRNGVDYVHDCPVPARATVTVYVTASEYSNPAATVLQNYPKHASPPDGLDSNPEYKSCFDRNSHALTYSYDNGGYHFGVAGGGVRTKESNTKALTQDGLSSLAYITVHSTSPTPTKTSSMLYTSYYQTTKVTNTSHYNATSSSLPYGTISNTTYSNTTSTSSLLPTNSSAPDCQPILQLDGASEYSFNKKNTEFFVVITGCSKFDVANTTAFANMAEVSGFIPRLLISSQSSSHPTLMMTALLMVK